MEFERCYSHRLGGPNDEVIQGHPLNGKGLEAYRAHEIRNSKWLAAERATNSVHSQFREESWTRTKHYFLYFNDECFECLAAATGQARARFQRNSGPEDQAERRKLAG